MNKLLVVLAALLASLVVAGVALAGKPDWFSGQEHLSDRIAESALNAVPYPESQVKNGGFLERKNLRERLLRFSKQSKIGYVYVMSFGKFVGYYVIKGKISSTLSQMTNTTQTWQMPHQTGELAVDSIGDDGSFGPNEEGVFFFTVTGVMVQTNLDYMYSDAPLRIDVPNLLNHK